MFATLLALLPTLEPIAAQALESMLRTHPDTDAEQLAKLDGAIARGRQINAAWAALLPGTGATEDGQPG